VDSTVKHNAPQYYLSPTCSFSSLQDTAARYFISDTISFTAKKKRRIKVRRFFRKALRSMHVMADALSVMVHVFDVAHLVMIRLRDSGERRKQRGARNQGEQAGNGLDNGVHGSTLA
jgi:hypothetical protein